MPIPLFPNKTENFFIQFDMHDGLFVGPLLPIPAVLPSQWHFGFGRLDLPVWSNSAFGEDKSNENKVLADGFRVVSRCHEPKHAIPHINLTPLLTLNILLPVLLLTSANKLEFAAGSVVAKDGPLAVSWYVGLSLTCNEGMSLPTGILMNWGSVMCGFTWADFFAGVGCILFDMAKSKVEDKAFSGLGNLALKKFPNLLKGQTSAITRRLDGLVPGAFLDAETKLMVLTSDAFSSRALPGMLGALYSRFVGGDWGADGVDWIKEQIGPTGDMIVDMITGDYVTGYDSDTHQHGTAMLRGQEWEAWLDSQAEKLFSGSESIP